MSIKSIIRRIMKYLSEYRNPELIRSYLDTLHEATTKPWKIMEICGGQTHGLVKTGLIDLLPVQIDMLHGPGCPVCVTPVQIIDEAIHLAMERGVTLCSFGDMLRVPGSVHSLLEAKAMGANVRMFYSPLQAVKYAQAHPKEEVVFFAVGFETTAPANALSVIQAKRLQLKNYAILTSQVCVPPAIETILDDPLVKIHGFLGAGHVNAIMGADEYHPICKKYHVPIVLTGFEPVDLLQGILMVVHQLEHGEARVENQYDRAVHEQGNPNAINMIREVFESCDREWRGLGVIHDSGFRINSAYQFFDAHHRFKLKEKDVHECETCIAGQILKGIRKPNECENFGSKCTPEHPLGAPMVSSEGACAAYYHHMDQLTERNHA